MLFKSEELYLSSWNCCSLFEQQGTSSPGQGPSRGAQGNVCNILSLFSYFYCCGGEGWWGLCSTFYFLAAEQSLYYRTPLHRQQLWVPGRSSHQDPRLSATRGRTAPLLLKGRDKGLEPQQSSGESRSVVCLYMQDCACDSPWYLFRQ